MLASDCRIRFQIAGDGPEFDELKMLQTELKLEDKVQFLGFRNDVPLLMKQSDLFVLPSLSEPFGNILLEYDGNRHSDCNYSEWLNLDDRRKLHICTADKLAVREYVLKSTNDPNLLNHLYGVYDGPDKI